MATRSKRSVLIRPSVYPAVYLLDLPGLAAAARILEAAVVMQLVSAPSHVFTVSKPRLRTARVGVGQAEQLKNRLEGKETIPRPRLIAAL